MKKITIFALAIILLTACKKDINEMPSDSLTQAELASKTNAEKEKVTVPMKIDFYSSVNAASPALTCTMPGVPFGIANSGRSEEHTSELQSQSNLVCRLLLEKKKKTI